MTTAAELITFLQKLPPETPVSVLEEHHSGWNTSTCWHGLELPLGDPIQDCTRNCECVGKTLYLGKC